MRHRQLRWVSAATALMLVGAGLALGQPLHQSPAPESQPDGQLHREPCTLQAGPTHTVVRVVDGETLQLDDGKELRLIGALAPVPPRYLAAGAAWPADTAARAALERLTLGKRVELAFSGRRADRWGRHLAHAFVIGRGQREWVQGTLLRSGHARAYVLPGNTECLAELLAHEREAMRAGAGLWASTAYRARTTDDPKRLMRLRNNFELLEGRVRKVAVTRTRIYLNFGDDWRTDVTAGAALRSDVMSREAVARLKGLEGARVRIRGWIERRNGPYVDIVHPLQIETIDEPELPPAPGIAQQGRDGAPGSTPAETEPQPQDEREPSPQTQERPEPKAPGVQDL